jgi:hypothetical protein
MMPGTNSFNQSPAQPTTTWSGSERYGWSAQSALDAPLSAVDWSSNVGTPIFDAISAWFASGPSAGGANSWSDLDDGGWQAANARAAEAPRVAGVSGSGLPQRTRGANMVPSASDMGQASRSMFGEPQRIDPDQVRSRLGGFQQALNTARTTSRPAPTPARGEESTYNAFYRDYLPQLMSMLMVQGARPVVAAELAQDVFAQASQIWTELDAPWDWVCNRALSVLAEWPQASG